ncbi:MAG: SDR family oxidoreductase [Bacteroidaceae bacterium]|nr:SDR family oxidoreductase [Bacteroidaceae bacterium]
MSIKTYIKRGLEYVLSGVPVKYTNSTIAYLEPSNKLKDKKIIITGGGRGLGRAMAKCFVDEGAQVLIAGRNENVLKDSANLIGCSYLKLDVQNVESFSAFIDEAWNILGGLDCLVNNAGVSHHEGNIRNVTLDDFNIQINTNLRSGYFLSQRFIERFEKNQLKNGKILFVSSERSMMADDLPYGITKSAVNTLVQGLANELINEGIRVNAIAPGVTVSDMTGYTNNGNLSLSSQATGRVYFAEEIAQIASFLLSDVSNIINGQVIVCNEGKSINYRR